jgi:hypothetical protein
MTDTEEETDISLHIEDADEVIGDRSRGGGRTSSN